MYIVYNVCVLQTAYEFRFYATFGLLTITLYSYDDLNYQQSITYPSNNPQIIFIPKERTIYISP